MRVRNEMRSAHVRTRDEYRTSFVSNIFDRGAISIVGSHDGPPQGLTTLDRSLGRLAAAAADAGQLYATQLDSSELNSRLAN